MMFYPQAGMAAATKPMIWNQTGFPPSPRIGVFNRSDTYVFVVMADFFGSHHANALFNIDLTTYLYELVGGYIGDVEVNFLRIMRRWFGECSTSLMVT